MKHFFEYNWQKRNEWFELFKDVPESELYKHRIGGLHSIAETLFHCIVVEYYWICDLQNIPVQNYKFSDFSQFNDITKLSSELHPMIKSYISNWNPEIEKDGKEYDFGGGRLEYLSFGEVIRHVIAHEIHHSGQLSIWARELDLEPVSANFILRGIT